MNVCIEAFGHLWCMVDYSSFEDLAYSQGKHDQHNSAEFSACYQGEHNPFPLMTKGESDLALPSSPNGKIVGIMTQIWIYDTGAVLDGNSLMSQIIVQT